MQQRPSLTTSTAPPARPWLEPAAGAAPPVIDRRMVRAGLVALCTTTALMLAVSAALVQFAVRPADKQTARRAAPAEQVRITHRITPQPVLLAEAAPELEESYRALVLVDAESIRAGGRLIRLGALGLPGRDAQCLTLDGRREPCWQRAATQLEVALRHHSATCRYRHGAAGVAEGTCRIGGRSIAEIAGRLTPSPDEGLAARAEVASTGALLARR
jgi:hypothetical protein